MEKKLLIKKTIALVAHDSRKQDMLKWSQSHKEQLSKHNLVATGTTGTLLSRQLGLKVDSFLSGPIGGDFQIGTAIVEDRVTMLIFFWDPLETLGHDPDVKALVRLATLYNIPMACNQASADFFMNSSLMSKDYQRQLSLIEHYQNKRNKTFK